MPRNYKRPLGVTGRCNYSQESIEDALFDVVEGGYSFRQAAERQGVPYATVYRKYKGLNPRKLGKPPVISPLEEKTIVDALLVAANYGYPMDEKDLSYFVKGYLDRKGIQVDSFHDNLPGPDWRASFMKRYPELTARTSENMKRARAAVTMATLSEYFDELHRSMEGVPPSNIINYDESNLTDDPGKKKVIVRRGVKHATRVMDSSKSSTSIMFCGAADGTLLPVYVVYKATHLYNEWVQGGPPGAFYNRSKNGWFNSELFEDWFFKVALPYLRRLEGKKIMIGDNLSSHLSINIIRKCNEENIEFKFLPPHSTHLCQPLDVSYFRGLKSAWRKVLTTWKLKNKGCVPKSIFPSLLNNALQMLGEKNETNIRAGFKATGIFPPDRREVFKRLPQTAEQELENNAMKESFHAIIENKMPSASSTPTCNRRTKINVQPGKSVKLSDLNNDEENETVSNNVMIKCKPRSVNDALIEYDSSDQEAGSSKEKTVHKTDDKTDSESETYAHSSSEGEG